MIYDTIIFDMSTLHGEILTLKISKHDNHVFSQAQIAEVV